MLSWFPGDAGLSVSTNRNQTSKLNNSDALSPLVPSFFPFLGASVSCHCLHCHAFCDFHQLSEDLKSFLIVLSSFNVGERTAAPVPPSSIMENGAYGGVSVTRSSAIAPVPRWVKEAPQRFWSFSPANSQRFPSSWPTGKRNIIISTTWCFLWIWEQLKCLASVFLLLLSY